MIARDQYLELSIKSFTNFWNLITILNSHNMLNIMTNLLKGIAINCPNNTQSEILIFLNYSNSPLPIAIDG